MNIFFVIIAGSLFSIISLILFIVDQNANAKAKKTKNGKNELRVGNNAYVGIVLQFLGFIIMTISAIDAVIQKSEMMILFISLTIIFLLGIIYLILEIINHKVHYDEEGISKTNLFKLKSEIQFQNLKSVNYSLFGFGRNLVFKDLKENRIKVHWHLKGFQSLVNYVKEKKLLKK